MFVPDEKHVSAVRYAFLYVWYMYIYAMEITLICYVVMRMYVSMTCLFLTHMPVNTGTQKSLLVLTLLDENE